MSEIVPPSVESKENFNGRDSCSGVVAPLAVFVLMIAPGFAGPECRLPGCPQPADAANLGLLRGPSAVSRQLLSVALPAAGGRLPPEILAEPGRSGAASGLPSEEVRCKGQPEGASCWMELASQPGCYVWNSYFEPDETVTWTAECSEGLAQGTGTLKEVWDAGGKSQEKTGFLEDGKAQGRWVYRDHEGNISEGAYEDGSKHGHWVERLADGTVQEGPYESGERHGDWVLRFASGTVMEGPFAAGKQQGRWVLRFGSGNVSEGSYDAGKRHGHWVEKFVSGTVQEGPYEEGKRQGRWVLRFTSGTVMEGEFAAGKRHGHWVERYGDGGVQEGPVRGGEAPRSVGGALLGRKRPGGPLRGGEGAGPLGLAFAGRGRERRSVRGGETPRPVGRARRGRLPPGRPVCGFATSRLVGDAQEGARG